MSDRVYRYELRDYTPIKWHLQKSMNKCSNNMWLSYVIFFKEEIHGGVVTPCLTAEKMVLDESNTIVLLSNKNYLKFKLNNILEIGQYKPKDQLRKRLLGIGWCIKLAGEAVFFKTVIKKRDWNKFLDMYKDHPTIRAYILNQIL